MKKLTTLALIIALISLAFTSNNSNASQPESCPMASDEALVCEVVLCSVGLLIKESRPKCIEVTKRFTIYVAKLGFWSKPPKCKMRDKDCNVTGKASSASISPSYCDELSTEEEQNSCRAGLGDVTQEYCDSFSGSDKAACEAEIK